MTTPPSPPILYIGIDWADEAHRVCLHDSRDNSIRLQVLPHDPAFIREWVAELNREFPSHQKLILVEQSRGPLIAALGEFPDLTIYPINPKQLSDYRKSNFPSGKKDDNTDATLLAYFLKERRHKLRPLASEPPETVMIGELVEMRRTLVDDRTSAFLRLKSTLKVYFPLALKLHGGKLDHPLMLSLLKRWPSLDALQAVEDGVLSQFLQAEGMSDADKQEKFIQDIRQALPLTTSEALIKTKSLFVSCLIKQIETLDENIRCIEKQIAELETNHPDRHIFRSLPGAGDVLVPRLIAGLGSDRDRYNSAEELQCYSGIAPIFIESGKSRRIAKRNFCPKFMKQTFHEFADQARRWSGWSKAFYRMKQQGGMKHHAILRALAYKWIRIIFHLWKTNTTYSEATYLDRLKRTNSPVVQFLET